MTIKYLSGRGIFSLVNGLTPVFLLLCLSMIHGCRIIESGKPNIIVFLADDLGSQDLGCYGQELIQTPNIDALAAAGMKWTNAYSSCPVCSPTRAAILTGKNPAKLSFTGHVTRVYHHRHPSASRIIPPDDNLHIPYAEVTLAEALQPAGYTSVCIGKWHVGGEGYYPLDQGFDESVGVYPHGAVPTHFYPYTGSDKGEELSITGLGEGSEGEYLADRLTDEAVHFIDNNKDYPFFMYLSHYAVHTPLDAPDSLIRKYQPFAEGTGIDPVYAAMVDNLDWNLGRLLRALDESGLSENTVIIFASDNGAMHSTSDNSPFRLGKGFLYEGGVRVPFIMKWEGRIEPGTMCANLTISPDIYSTVIDIAGDDAQPGENLDGQSLTGDFIFNPDKRETDLFWYYPHYNTMSKLPGAMVISGDYKFIEFYDPEKTELYNLKTDIGETKDLSVKMPGKKEEMLIKLHGWLDEADPVRHTLNTNK